MQVRFKICGVYNNGYIVLGLPRGSFYASNDIPVEPPSGESEQGIAQGSVMFYTNSDDTPYYKWMIVLTGCVVVVVLIQAGFGICFYRR